MNSKTVQSDGAPDGAFLRLPVPVREPEAFRHAAAADVLHLLVDNPELSFTNRELHRVTGRGMSGVNAAVDALETLGLIEVDRSGRANAVRIDPAMLVNPADPVTTIPQSEYHRPVREILSRLESRLGSDIGVVLFGSVARGTADRASDIDLFMIVEEGRMEAQREAHAVEQAVADERFDGERYEPHIVVETRASGASHDHVADVLVEGLTLSESPELQAVKAEVFDGGAR